MDSKQLVALWYGGAALAFAHIVFGVSGYAVALGAVIMLAVMVARAALGRRSMRTERQLVAAGVPLLAGQLVLSVVLVAQWGASSCTGLANGDPTSHTLASLPGQTSTTVDDAIDKTVSALTDGAKTSSPFTRNQPHQSATLLLEPSPATRTSRAARDKQNPDSPDAACQPSDDVQGHGPRDGLPVGCAREGPREFRSGADDSHRAVGAHRPRGH